MTEFFVSLSVKCPASLEAERFWALHAVLAGAWSEYAAVEQPDTSADHGQGRLTLEGVVSSTSQIGALGEACKPAASVIQQAGSLFGVEAGTLLLVAHVEPEVVPDTHAGGHRAELTMY